MHSAINGLSSFTPPWKVASQTLRGVSSGGGVSKYGQINSEDLPSQDPSQAIWAEANGTKRNQ